MELLRHKGGCHCGAVTFEVEAPGEVTVYECNCSICHACGFLHLLVPAKRFQLLTGTAQLTAYTFNTHTARHLFCSICGVKSFYVPRSHPEAYSVNLRCLDQRHFVAVCTEAFDGRNWESQHDTLPELGD